MFVLFWFGFWVSGVGCCSYSFAGVVGVGFAVLLFLFLCLLVRAVRVWGLCFVLGLLCSLSCVSFCGGLGSAVGFVVGLLGCGAFVLGFVLVGLWCVVYFVSFGGLVIFLLSVCLFLVGCFLGCFL